MRTRLDFCSYNFHIFRFSRSGKLKVDVYRFKSKHGSTSSDITVCFSVTITCHTSPSTRHHTWSWHIDGVEVVVVLYSDTFHQWASTDYKVFCKFFLKSLFAAIWRKIYHYQQNMSQHYYLLDTLVIALLIGGEISSSNLAFQSKVMLVRI